MRHVSIALALLALAPAAARAAPTEEDRSWYAVAKLGGFVPSNNYKDPSGIDQGSLKNSPAWEFGLGTAFGPGKMLGAEISAGRTTTTAAGMDLSLVPVIASFRFQVPIQVPAIAVTPYAEAGAGAFFSKATLTGSSKSTTAFGYQLGAGADLYFGPLLVGVDARYQWVEPSFGDPIGKVKANGFVVLGKAGIRF